MKMYFVRNPDKKWSRRTSLPTATLNKRCH